MTGPDPSLDLVSLYGLGSVARSVARLDPVTGEKINRLRKSYEGKLKGLGLAGRNKPVKQEPGAPGSLRHLTMWPEEEWQNQKVFGKQIKVADIDSALHNLQTRAMHFEPGPVPNNDFWEDVLGHEKPVKQQGAGDGGKKALPPLTGRPSVQAQVGSSQFQEPERTRPSRGRKRHYDDNSFVGYGEGYADDDEDPGFYSSGEGTGKKKRKKVWHCTLLLRVVLTSRLIGPCLESFHTSFRTRWELWGGRLWNWRQMRHQKGFCYERMDMLHEGLDVGLIF